MLNPLGPVASAFHDDNSRVACIMGPVGSGKTTAAAYRFVRHAFQQHPDRSGTVRFRGVIIRNTGPQLRDTTMDTWFRLFPRNGKGMRFVSTTNTHQWKIPFKDTHGQPRLLQADFLFRPLEDEADARNLLSLDITGAWCNELREIDPKIFSRVLGRCGRYPGADLGGCAWYGVLADTNPWAFTSPYHKWFVADKLEGFAFFKQAGGLSEDAENLENLLQDDETRALPLCHPLRKERGRMYYTNILQTADPYEASTLVHCNYGTSRSGKPVYASYDDNVHCKAFELGRIVLRSKSAPVVPVRIGYDNTGRHPAALIAQRTEAGQWRARYEVIGDGMGMRQHAQVLAAFLAQKVPNAQIERITCDPAGAAKGADDLDMRSIVMRQFPGVQVLNARTNDPETRIAAVEDVLRRLVNGEPALLIHPDCKILRDACIEKYQYRKLKLSGDERFTETPDKISPYADIADALQYLLLGGGEGRVFSDGTGKEPNWPKNGAAVTPKPPDQQRRSQGAVFDPRMGTFFNER